MKNFTLLILFLSISSLTKGQEKRESLSESKIFVNGDYDNKHNRYNYIGIQNFLKDTLIKKKSFKKYELNKFQDYSKDSKKEVFYETFSNGEYIKLDKNLAPIHSVNFEKETKGSLFEVEGEIKIEYVDTRNYFPKDSLIPDETTPRKLFLKENPEIYIALRPDLKIVELAANKTNYTKHLIGDIFTNLSKGLKNTEEISNKLSLNTGDEIQLYYRRKWYNDTTHTAEYEAKQFKTIKYIGDTLIEDKEAFKFSLSGFNYLSGKEENGEFLIQKTDSGYYYGNQLIKYETFKPEFKIVEQDSADNYIFLQSYVIDEIDGKEFPRIIQYNSLSPYRYYILPYFPVPYFEFGNVEGKIAYVRKANKEYGQKKKIVWRTDGNHIRKLNVVTNTKIELKYYLTNETEVRWLFYEPNSEPKTLLTSNGKKGENTISITTPSLNYGESYQIQMEVETENGKTVVTQSFKSNLK